MPCLAPLRNAEPSPPAAATTAAGRPAVPGRARRPAPRILILAAPLLLAACALPLPLQIASWGADGISYLTTHKSVSDHGISAVAGRDCALYRGLTEGAVCRDAAPDETQLARAPDPTADAQDFVLGDADDTPQPVPAPREWEVLTRIAPAAGAAAAPPAPLAAGACRAVLDSAAPPTRAADGAGPWPVLNCVAIAG